MYKVARYIVVHRDRIIKRGDVRLQIFMRHQSAQGRGQFYNSIRDPALIKSCLAMFSQFPRVVLNSDLITPTAFPNLNVAG